MKIPTVRTEGVMRHLLTSVLMLAISSSIPLPDARSQVRNVDHGFILGIFRPNGVIVPFARYARRRWTNPWHQRIPDAQSDEPKTIADLPRPWYRSFVKPTNKWQVILPTRRPSIAIALKNIQVCSHCQKVWGALTDYPNPKEPDKNECVWNLGIALNKNRQALAVSPITDRARDWQRMLRFMARRFDRDETTGLAHTVPEFVAQLPPPQVRTGVKLSILNLYRVRIPGKRTVFYFEASKEYPKPTKANDPGCNNISLLSGWVARNTDGRLRLLASEYSATDCDMKEGALDIPYAMLRLDGKTFAIVEEAGYEGESYVVLEIGRRSIRRVLETYAGSC
jgi:hypothetical protein